MTAVRRDRPLGARLFAEPERPADVYTAKVDGASRGNPGPASYAVIVCKPDGSVLYQLGKYLGMATNNVAEYFALITALDYCAANNISRLRVRSDSELLVRQMQGRYKVKSAALKPLHERAIRQSKSFGYFAIEHVPREMNADADALANAALDRAGEVVGGARPAKPAPVSQTTSVLPRGAASIGISVRARYQNGALRPIVPIELPEGAEVEIVIRRDEQS